MAYNEILDIDEIGVKEKVEQEVKRFKKFQQMLLGKSDEVSVKDIDIKNYIKYLLREGSLTEKREVMEHFKSRLILKDKEVRLSNIP